MAVKIDKKIKGYAVVTAEEKGREAAPLVVAAPVDRATVQAEPTGEAVARMRLRIFGAKAKQAEKLAA